MSKKSWIWLWLTVFGLGLLFVVFKATLASIRGINLWLDFFVWLIIWGVECCLLFVSTFWFRRFSFGFLFGLLGVAIVWMMFAMYGSLFFSFGKLGYNLFLSVPTLMFLFIVGAFCLYAFLKVIEGLFDWLQN